MDSGNYDRRGTPLSSQIVWLEGRVKELEAENEQLKAKLDKLAVDAIDCLRHSASEIERLRNDRDAAHRRIDGLEQAEWNHYHAASKTEMKEAK